MGNFFENNSILIRESSREILLKLDAGWTTIVVSSVFHHCGGLHYHVDFPWCQQIELKKNDHGEWLEVENGPTELSGTIGKAIDNFVF